MASPRPAHTFNNPGYNLANGSTSGPTPGATALLPNNGRVIQTGGVRVLCVADVRGNLKSLNELAKQARADHIIHTGDFGFYDDSSLERIAEKTLRHVVQYSPLLPETTKKSIAQVPSQQSIKQRFSPEQLPLSELPLLLNKQLTLDIPVYTVWGACEDVRVLEKFRSGEYKVDKLHIIDEASSRLLDVGGVKLRLLGLGGAVVMHKLFDNGEGKTTIAGGQGTMWTTLLQMGELVDTANRVYDPSETRVFVTHASPAREGMLNQLSVTLKADFSISAGLHFRYGSSYNEFSVNPTLDHYRGKLAASKASFNDVWDTVKGEVETAINANEAQRTLLDNALNIVEKMPTIANGGNPFGGPVAASNAGGQVDESAFKNMWNFNLADAAFGYLVLEIDCGRIGTEMRAQGFNFSHRTGKQATAAPPITQQPSTVPGAPGPGAHPGQPRPTGGVQFGQTPVPNRGGAGTTYQQPTQPPPAQNKPAGPLPPKTTASPAPVIPNNKINKPATPQPTGANVNVPASSTDKANESNGTAHGAGDRTDSRNDSRTGPPQERKQSSGLFISNVDSEQAIRDLFTDDDKAKILKVEKWGKFNHVVTFSTPEEAKSALDRLPADHKKPSPPGPNRKPNVKMFEDRGSRRDINRGDGNAGTWQASNRGGGAAGAAAANVGQRSGYQSGSASSDLDIGRGRGGFGGGRGRGGRGGDRGGRGGDRGARGGRGGYGGAGDRGELRERGGASAGAAGGKGESPAPATTTPAPAPAGEAKGGD
ncbi:serine/threonine protein phosphatase [Histoplasma capsulatum var. duboisii H88]|uniref:Serine/threonine protein phosphatase n=1 Tax=Ajellomyces capsulatus (strain H88) TaxID=544711 RepID=F0UU12_AJEC8|nr:serine/threonine protein phosphatase [Histoplasma capsulatum var. duboisii H88]